MQKGFALTANFSEFCMSQARIIGPEFVTLEKSICSAWQPASPFAEHRRDDQPHFTHKCMLLLVKDANSRTSYSDNFFCSTDTQLLPAELWPPNCHTKAISLSLVDPGVGAMVWETKSSILQSQAHFDSPHCPVGASIKQMNCASVNQHKCAQQSSSVKLKEQNAQLGMLTVQPGYSESRLCGW